MSAPPPGAHPARGVLLMVAACTLFAMLDSVAKTLSARYPTPMIVWARYVVHVLVMLAVMWPSMGRRLFATRHPGLQLVRGACLGASTLFFFGAIAYMPLAEATSVVQIAPILVTVAAVAWLGEKAPVGSAWSLALSFAGVLLIVRPGSALFGWASMLPLGTAAFMTVYHLLTRRLTGIDDGVATLFLGGVVSAAMMSTIVPLYWRAPTNLVDMGLFVATGVIGASGHLLLVRAYEHASASTLAPYGYAHVVAALAFGWLVFGNFPDSLALAGMALIVGTGVWMAWRHHMPAAPIED